MNNKNKLQEYFQKKRSPLPSYETTRHGGPDHKPSWKSTVFLYDGSKFTGEIFFDKISAENSAALNALNYYNFDDEIYLKLEKINLIDKPEKKINLPNSEFVINESLLNFPRKNNKIALLVDVENLHKFIDEFNFFCDQKNQTNVNLNLNNFSKTSLFNSKFDPNYNKNFDIYAFINKNHDLADKIFPEYVKKVICPSLQKNGTDTYMQVFVGTLLAKEMYEIYIIATKDHFGNLLTELINSPNLEWTSKKAYLIVKPSQLFELS
jgi:Double-stranded RNA binding motif